MILWVTNDRDASTVFGNSVAFGHGVDSVVGPLGLNVRSNLANDGTHIELGEDHDCVDIGERGHDFGTLFRRHDRPPVAFESAHRFVRIDGDYQPTAQGLCAAQVAHMTHVEQVEISVGERDAFTRTPPLFDARAQFGAVQDFIFGFQNCIRDV